MELRIKRIAPVQLGKVLAVIYALISLFFFLFMLIATIAAPEEKEPGLLFTFIMPVLYIIFGFIGGIIGAIIYNYSAKWVGGIIIDLEE